MLRMHFASMAQDRKKSLGGYGGKSVSTFQSVIPPDEIFLTAVAVRFVRGRYVPQKPNVQRLENERHCSCRTCPGQPSC